MIRRDEICLCLLAVLSPMAAQPGRAATGFERHLVVNDVEWQQGGVPAVGDLDGDGYPDLVLTAQWPFGSRVEAAFLPQGQYVGRRATLVDGDSLQVAVSGGAVLGDYDGDGDIDIFVPVLGGAEFGARNYLLRNDGGLFFDVAVEAGLVDSHGTVDAAWFDFDADGELDLLVRNRGGARPEDLTVDIIIDTTQQIPAGQDLLYRNMGQGRFEDVTVDAGLESRGGLLAIGFDEGVAAQDLNGDLLPDLFLGAAGALNRLLLNDGSTFADGTVGDLVDGGVNAGVAVGDINNDGAPDIIEAEPTATVSGVSSAIPFATKVLLNVGGQFLDFTAASGLQSVLERESEHNPVLADLDADGDLDLTVSVQAITQSPPAIVVPPSLYIFDNHGDGTFEAVDAGPINERWLDRFAIADFDRDGWLDIVTSPYVGQSGMGQERTGEWVIYRNQGTKGHWLGVELVGRSSHRGGIGAQVRASTGAVEQLRQVVSGHAWSQHERIVHLGLGPHRTVDRLQIDWPSGQTQVFENVPADQYVRVIEGLDEPLDLRPSRLDVSGSDELHSGVSGTWRARVEPQAAAPGATASAVADLSDLGGPASVPFEVGEDGTLKAEVLLVPGVASGWKNVVVHVAQQSLLGETWSHLRRRVPLFPAGDLQIYGDAVALQWQARLVRGGALEVDVEGEGRGDRSMWLDVDNRAIVDLVVDEPIDTLGYRALHLALKPDGLRNPAVGALSLTLAVNQSVSRVSLLSGENTLGLDAEVPEWQSIEIPLSAFALEQSRIGELRLDGRAQGGLYIDDVRLLARSQTTAVRGHRDATPTVMTLGQNYPNPFNAETQLVFELDRPVDVKLELYDLLGQRIRTLATGLHGIGQHRVRWDGRDAHGEEVAGGVYIYQLSGGTEKMSRKLLLLR